MSLLSSCVSHWPKVVGTAGTGVGAGAGSPGEQRLAEFPPTEPQEGLSTGQRLLGLGVSPSASGGNSKPSQSRTLTLRRRSLGDIGLSRGSCGMCPDQLRGERGDPRHGPACPAGCSSSHPRAGSCVDILLWAGTGKTGTDTSGLHGEGDRKALTETEQPRVGALLPQACTLPTVKWEVGRVLYNLSPAAFQTLQ